MTSLFRFLQWPVYSESKKLFDVSLEIVKKLPKEYRFEVGSQLIRASQSISLNIAEGSGKHSDKDFNHFMNISLGSLSETVAIADMLKDNKMISDEEFKKILEISSSVSNQIGGFKKKLTAHSKLLSY